MIKKTPAVNVDNLLVAPDFTLMTDWPIIAQPPIPPNRPVMILAIPWPLDSLFLLLWESVASSTILAVNKLSTNPTIAIDKEYGKMIANVSKLKGTCGIKKFGNALVIVPKSPTVLTLEPVTIYSVVNKIIAISGAGMALKYFGTI